MPKITKTGVDHLGLGDRPLWDSEIRGFGVRPPRASGGAKVYVLKKGNRWLTIGPHGSPWTVETARKRALHLLGEIVAGRDPGAERKTERIAGAMTQLCELYLREGVTTLKPSTVRNHESRIRCHIKPLLGTRRVRDIGRGDIERFQQAVADGRTAHDLRTGPRGRSIVTGGKGAARLTMMLLSAIFSFAISRGLRQDNPCVGVARFKPGRFERFLSAVELVRLGQALSAALEAGANPTAIAAIRLLAITGMRRGEALRLRWNEVDHERGCLRLPDSKTGYRIIPLGGAALALLACVERRGDYVFPSEVNHTQPIADISGIWQRVRKSADLGDMRLHDLRHSFASNIANSGGSLPLIGALLGHRNVSTTQRYAHLADDPVRAVADRAAGSIAAALSGAAPTEVVQLAQPERRQRP
jgi:integrase